jgi:hypothetical protein
VGAPAVPEVPDRHIIRGGGPGWTGPLGSHPHRREIGREGGKITSSLADTMICDRCRSGGFPRRPTTSTQVSGRIVAHLQGAVEADGQRKLFAGRRAHRVGPAHHEPERGFLQLLGTRAVNIRHAVQSLGADPCSRGRDVKIFAWSRYGGLVTFKRVLVATGVLEINGVRQSSVDRADADFTPSRLTAQKTRTRQRQTLPWQRSPAGSSHTRSGRGRDDDVS